ncbi:MAG TPA: hypothetical protein VFB19_06410 [Mycobacterium sp.]|nr:hypothetical protein [Mycobacterium sp.]
MSTRKRLRLLARAGAVTLPLAVAVVAAAAPAVVRAEPPADDCVQGFIWRQATAGDRVCVNGGMAHEVHVQNLHPAANQVPDSDTCVSGFVWREAFDGDHVCVTPDFRQQVRADNAAAASRVVKAAPAAPPENSQHVVHLAISTFNTTRLVHFAIEPPGIDERWESTAPWSRDITIGPETTSLSLKGWTSGQAARCSIEVDGVQVSQMEGSFVWCKWHR